jgi:hypothetical protein
MAESGQLYACKDFFLLFFADFDEAQGYATSYMSDDYYMSYHEASFELGDYMFSYGQASSSDVYRPNELILFLGAVYANSQQIQHIIKKPYDLYQIILNEKVGWIPLFEGSFEKYFTKW